MTTSVAPPSSAPVIVWFRRDLRVGDHPALQRACDTGRPVIGLYVLDEETQGVRALGGASRWWLHNSLRALDTTWRALTGGAGLVLRRGLAADVVLSVAEETGASGVCWNRLYEPALIARDQAIKTALKAADREAVSCKAALLHEPWTIETGSGGPYRVFTPFWRACRARGLDDRPLPAPATITAFKQSQERPIASDRLDDWELLPTKPDWAGGLRDTWTPGEAGGQARLEAFLDGPVLGYDAARDLPGRPGTSMLSPHLHFGEVSPRQVVAGVRNALGPRADEAGATTFLSEIGWREFAHNLLFHNPDFPTQNHQAKFDAFPWRDAPGDLAAWTRGRTGYPIVDAGIRQLWSTGWMHNRVRMVVGSFLVKHLLIDWREGEKWFWDTLVDADLANNAAGWQWIAGTGADAAPYFRIFNPIAQGEKFDRDGSYVRRFVPELQGLPNAVLHAPWTADTATLAKAGVRLGLEYPHPIVEHKAARERALLALEKTKSPA